MKADKKQPSPKMVRKQWSATKVMVVVFLAVILIWGGGILISVLTGNFKPFNF